jgi:predicted nucleic acid-binding protein
VLKKILIDTNAYSRFLAGDENVLAALIEARIAYMSGQNADEVLC